jgi:hypothetical protein
LDKLIWDHHELALALNLSPGILDRKNYLKSLDPMLLEGSAVEHGCWQAGDCSKCDYRRRCSDHSNMCLCGQKFNNRNGYRTHIHQIQATKQKIESNQLILKYREDLEGKGKLENMQELSYPLLLDSSTGTVVETDPDLPDNALDATYQLKFKSSEFLGRLLRRPKVLIIGNPSLSSHPNL